MMAKLEKIWIEEGDVSVFGALRIDWDNDRHQRIEIRGDEPKDIVKALDFAIRLIKSEALDREI